MGRKKGGNKCADSQQGSRHHPGRPQHHPSGKLAGLGKRQVEAQITVEAQCINPGKKHPKAANKESFAGNGTFPVENGKADYELTVTASFQPVCSPPMTVAFANLVITDLTHGISQSFPGPI